MPDAPPPTALCACPVPTGLHSGDKYFRFTVFLRSERARHRIPIRVITLASLAVLVVYMFFNVSAPVTFHRTVATERASEHLVFPPAPVAPLHEPFILTHISDTHIREESDFTQLTLSALLDWVSMLQPDAIVNTGDLTNAIERASIFQRHQIPEEWAAYERILRETGLIGTYGLRYTDTRGNHDVTLAGERWDDERNLYRTRSSTGPVLDSLEPGGYVVSGHSALVALSNNTYTVWHRKESQLVRVQYYTSAYTAARIPAGYFGVFTDAKARALDAALSLPPPPELCNSELPIVDEVRGNIHNADHSTTAPRSPGAAAPAPGPGATPGCAGCRTETFLASHHCIPMTIQAVENTDNLIWDVLRRHRVHYSLCGHDHLAFSMNRLTGGTTLTLGAPNTAQSIARVVAVDNGAVSIASVGYGQDLVLVTAPPSALTAMPDSSAAPPGTARVLVFDVGGATAWGMESVGAPTASMAIGNRTVDGDAPLAAADLTCRPRPAAAPVPTRKAGAYVCEGRFDPSAVSEGVHYMRVEVTFSPDAHPRTTTITGFITLNGKVAPARRYAKFCEPLRVIPRSMLAGWGDHDLIDSYASSLRKALSSTIQHYTETGALGKVFKTPSMVPLLDLDAMDLASGEHFSFWVGLLGFSAVAASCLAALPIGPLNKPVTQILLIIITFVLFPSLICPWTGGKIGYSNLFQISAGDITYDDPFFLATAVIVLWTFAVPVSCLRCSEKYMQTACEHTFYIQAILGHTPDVLRTNIIADELSRWFVRQKDTQPLMKPLLPCENGVCTMNISLRDAHRVNRHLMKVNRCGTVAHALAIVAFAIPIVGWFVGFFILNIILGTRWVFISPLTGVFSVGLFLGLSLHLYLLHRGVRSLGIWPPRLLPHTKHRLATLSS